MIIWVIKYAKYIDIKIIKSDYSYIIECEDDYILTEFKYILAELKINYTIHNHRILISYKYYNFDKIGGINVFIDQCKNIINHKYQIERIKKELTILN